MKRAPTANPQIRLGGLRLEDGQLTGPIVFIGVGEPTVAQVDTWLREFGEWLEARVR